jgi:hypothetical protein
LNWEPVWDFGSAVERTVAWYKNFLANQSDAREIFNSCLEDVNRYTGAASEKGLSWTF